MAKLKWKLPPLYMPSSGSMVRVKLRMSSGLGKEVFMVRPRVPSSSARSEYWGKISLLVPRNELDGLVITVPFCTRN